MCLADIPPNNANHPRWLLDLDDWRVRKYDDVKVEVGALGYGIVSYTWGKWLDEKKKVWRTPGDMNWEVPYVTVLDLELAKKVMKTMGMRYVWWDWMCVPQGGGLCRELLKVKKEEIEKQMMIYKGAKKSIVWVHQTTWQEGTTAPGEQTPEKSTLEKMLLGELPTTGDIGPDMNVMRRSIERVQEQEPWLTSIWTLQEGVLLSETPLLDNQGNALRGPKFMHNDGHAAVIDLTAGVTEFATKIARAFMRYSEHDTGDGTPVGRLVQVICRNDQSYISVSRLLSQVLRSGLVAYATKSPLYILAGKHSRRHSVPEDTCWALLGAMELDDIETWYDNDNVRDMDKVKRVFFISLLKKYQWSLLIAARPEDPVTWPERIAEGSFLPLGIFFDVHLENNLPTLEWERGDHEKQDALVLKDRSIPFFTLKKLGYCRMYEQNMMDDFIQVRKIRELKPDNQMLFLHIASLPARSTTRGMKCIAIKELKYGVGFFRGLVDLWVADEGFITVPYDQYSLLGGWEAKKA